MSRDYFWALSTLVIAIILAIILLAISRDDRSRGAAVPGEFFHSPFDQRLAAIEHEAIDEAYRQRVRLLFQNWLNDTRDQPARMLVGINNARRIYTEAMTEVQKRESQ